MITMILNLEMRDKHEQCKDKLHVCQCPCCFQDCYKLTLKKPTNAHLEVLCVCVCVFLCK